MRLLLIGANGQVGHELRRALAPLGEVVMTTRAGTLDDGSAAIACDLLEPDAAVKVISATRPDIVVNAAADTAVDKAESDPAVSMRVNAEAVNEIAQACSSSNVPLVHYSTDYVFDGSATSPYRPEDPVDPLGQYGVAKVAGEKAIRESGAQYLILRTAWVYGFHGHNFLKTMLRLGAECDELRVVADQAGSPTPAWLIADATAAIIRQGIGAGGTHHLVSGGQTNWHEFAKTIFDQGVARGMLQRRPTVHAITSAEYPTPARRPRWSVLDTNSLRTRYHIDLPDWQDALSETFARHVAVP